MVRTLSLRVRCAHALAAAGGAMGLAASAMATGLGPPTATFAGTPPTLTSFSVLVTVGNGNITPLANGTPVTLCYLTPAGVALPGIPAAVGLGGVLTVPPPPIPAAAAGLGGKVSIKEPTFGTTAPLVWYNSAWFGTTAAIKIDPVGIPTPGGTQHWFFDLSFGPVTFGNSSTEFGPRSLSVLDSGFDVRYASSPSAPGFFDVFATGSTGFVQFGDADTTRMSLVDGTLLGQIQINPLATAGLLSLPGLGLTGSWNYDSMRDYTDATMTPTGTFQAPAISVIPGPSAALALALGTIVVRGRRRPSA
jgi:hypothetical protein